MSPAFLTACRKAGLEPGRDYDLGSIRIFATAGSPLPVEGYRYVYDQLGDVAQPLPFLRGEAAEEVFGRQAFQALLRRQ